MSFALPTSRFKKFPRWSHRAALVLALAWPAAALADDDAPDLPEGVGGEDVITIEGGERDTQRAPRLSSDVEVDIDAVNVTIYQLIQQFAQMTGRNFILGKDTDYNEEVTIISHQPVPLDAAYQAFLQALELRGYTTVELGEDHRNIRVVQTSEASQTPIDVHVGDTIPHTANFVTQMMRLENVPIGDLQELVSSLAGPQARVVGYAPNNTFIITDAAHNIRRIHRVVNELDVAAPRTHLEIIPIVYAQAAEVKALIDELYGDEDQAQQSDDARERRRRRPRRRRRRPRRDEDSDSSTESVTAGERANFISKVIADERTNSLIVRANDRGMQAIKDLIEEVDVDVDPAGRSQIHVVYLEHATASEMAQVLANLSEGGGAQGRDDRGRPDARARARARRDGGDEDGVSDEAARGVTAAFDSGMRITYDETTNSLVIVASNDDFRVVSSVIEKLDIRRRQVMIDAVIMEISSRDEMNVGVGWHGPFDPVGDEGSMGIIGGQFGATSAFGLSQDLLSGLAMGVFGPALEVPISMGDGSMTNLQVPAFGIVLQALRTSAAVNIVSNPQLFTLDNEEAKIVVGRKVPFPQQAGFSQFGTPQVTFQREDVATTLRITPRVNSADYVTLEVIIEVAEVEEDQRGLDVSQAGFITSRREIDTNVLVRDNQTAVLGGLMGMTDNRVETKVPLLGDLPLIGVLFRGTRNESRKSNLMLFLTPHIIDDDDDMLEVMKVKEAQRQEFIRRFYGKSREEQLEEIDRLLDFSMNRVGEPSMYRGPVDVESSEPADRSGTVEGYQDPSGTSQEPEAQEPEVEEPQAAAQDAAEDPQAEPEGGGEAGEEGSGTDAAELEE